MPTEITQGEHSNVVEEPEVEEVEEEVKAVNETENETKGENWGADSQEEKEVVDEKPEAHPNTQDRKGGVKKKPHQRHKQATDDDGFTMIKDQRFHSRRQGKQGGRGRGGY